MDIKLRNIHIDNRPEGYIPSNQLVMALEIAYALKRPLLLTGEPGTGKTEFAKWAASRLVSEGFNDKPFVYNTKSSSTAQDLFYNYDAVAHFRETGLQKPGGGIQKTTEDFIELKALGLAFAHAKGKDNLNLGETIIQKSGISKTPKRSVVLIDEIDKAPRDFPNDLLNEIEHFEFEIKEIVKSVKLEKEEEKERILIILTSNFEKNLPEAFLRRCIYFHIDFPDNDQLYKIMNNRLNITEEEIPAVKERIDDFFRVYYDSNLQKKPSTSEALDWMRTLQDNKLLDKPLFENGKPFKESLILKYMPLLLKKKEDLLSYRF